MYGVWNFLQKKFQRIIYMYAIFVLHWSNKMLPEPMCVYINTPVSIKISHGIMKDMRQNKSVLFVELSVIK